MKDIKITWLGTASVKIETPETVLISDPYIEMRGAENPNSAVDFAGADAILITHAHLDHLGSLPRIMSEYPTDVYCTECAAKHLDNSERIHLIAHGSSFSVGDSEISVYKGKHIKFDKKLVRETLSPANLAGDIGNAVRLFRQNMKFRENDETVFYDIRADGKHIQIMGSLALRENIVYPENADILFLPYQGSSYPESEAAEIIKRLMPKQIIATHFDNAFPPVSKSVDTGSLVKMAEEKFPEIKVIIPRFGEEIIF